MTQEIFGPAARADLRQALDWIAQDNEAAAHAMLQATLQSAHGSSRGRSFGPQRPEMLPAPFRFWRVSGFPYLLVYDAARQPPVVLRLLHMARDLRPLLANLSDLANEPLD